MLYRPIPWELFLWILIRLHKSAIKSKSAPGIQDLAWLEICPWCPSRLFPVFESDRKSGQTLLCFIVAEHEKGIVDGYPVIKGIFSANKGDKVFVHRRQHRVQLLKIQKIPV